MTFKKNDEITKENIDFEKDNVFRIENNSDTFEVLVDNESIVKFDFTDVVLEEHVCNSDGIEKEYTHDASQACYNERVYCTECGKTISTHAQGHSFGDETIEYAHTKEVCYTATSNCMNCNAERVRSVGHDWNETPVPYYGVFYECNRESCGYSYTHQHVESTKKEFTNSKDSYCYADITYCTECNKETNRKEVPHNFSKSYNDTKTKVTYDCQNPDCEVSYSENHMHSWTVESYDDEIENLVCDCGETSDRSHTLSNGTWGECSTCDYTKEYTGHFHTEDPIPTIEEPSELIEDYCYIAIYKCKDCHQETRRVTVLHDIDYDHPLVLGPVYEYHCKNCDYYKTEIKLPNNNLDSANYEINEVSNSETSSIANAETNVKVSKTTKTTKKKK